MAELCLGTVQFGMKYGVNNQIGRQPTREESFEMLDAALDGGISVIDTARAYGEAELVLGEYFRTSGRNFSETRVVSKLRPNVIEPGEKDVLGACKREVEDSLRRMGLSRLDGYLFHTPQYIYQPKLVNALVKLKEEGYTDHIGISIYDIAEGETALETGVMDYLQMPYSILDQRGIKTGFLHKCKAQGLTVATRSAFLQGLFMMEEEQIPDYLESALPYLHIMTDILHKYQVNKVDAILAFVASEADIDYLVFGVEKFAQIRENLARFKALNVPTECIRELKERIENVDQSIIFPSLWSNGKKAE